MTIKRGQKHMEGTTRAGVEGALVGKEIAYNSHADYLELIYKNLASGYVHFPSEERLSFFSTPALAGASLLGVSGDNFNTLTGDTHAQNVLDEIDSILTSILAGSSGDNLSNTSVIFGIDEDANSTAETFSWRKDGTTNLMTLSEDCHLSLLSGTPRINFIDANTYINYNGVTLSLQTNQQIKLIASDEISLISGGANNIRIDVNAFDIDNLASNNLRIRSNTSMHFNIDQDNNSTIENFIWHTNASTELMRLTESGNLGIGINAPTQGLHLYNKSLLVESSSDATARINGTVNSVLYFGNASSNYFGVNGGATEIRSSGQMSLLTNSGAMYLQGFSGVDIVSGRLLLAASTTSYPSLRVPHGTAPTTPTNGDLYSTTAGWYGRTNGATKKLDVSTLKELSDNSPLTADMVFKNKAGQVVDFQSSSSASRLAYDDNFTLVTAPEVRIVASSASNGIQLRSRTYKWGNYPDACWNWEAQTTPTTLVDGDWWFDGTDFKVRVGGVTKTVVLA